MTTRIEGHDYTLFKDLDTPLLPRLSFRGKVRWLELRMRRMLIRPLDVLKPRRRGRTAEDVSFLLIFGSVLFNGVEALGGFYRGQRGSQKTFTDFIKDFMNPIYRPHTPELRDDFRNGLAHGLAVKNGGFEFLKGASLRLDPVRGVQIDPDFLLRDFKRALRTYLQRLRSGGPTSNLGQDFLKRFRQVFGA